MLAQEQAAPPRDIQPAASAGTGQLAGRVIAADTHEPVRWALLSLTGLNRQFAAKATSDADGRFAFGGLPSGGYVLHASKGGFVASTHGVHRRRDAPVAITVGPGLTATADMALRRGGAIDGHVTTEAGDPSYDVVVRASRWGYAGGPRLIQAGSLARTDDRGYFRLHSLPPGRYVVDASPPPHAPSDDAHERSQRSRPFARTFYPGTPRLGEASSVVVLPGHTASVDFSISNVQVSRWIGTVEDSRGHRPEKVAASLKFRDGPQIGAIAGSSSQFGFAPLAPGDYILGVVTATERREPEFAMIDLVMRGQDVKQAPIRTAPGVTVRGKLEIESAPALLPPSGLAVVAVSALFPDLAGDPNGRDKPVPVAPDGTFVLQHVLGPRLVRIQSSPTWAIKQVLLGDRDITDSGADFSALRELQPLRIVVTNHTGSVSGGVSVDGVADGQVVVFAQNEQLWGPESRFTKVVDVRRDGRFEVLGLLPGTYFAAYAPDLEPGSWTDREVLRDLRTPAVGAQVAAGADTPVLLKGAPAR